VDLTYMRRPWPSWVIGNPSRACPARPAGCACARRPWRATRHAQKISLSHEPPSWKCDCPGAPYTLNRGTVNVERRRGGRGCTGDRQGWQGGRPPIPAPPGRLEPDQPGSGGRRAGEPEGPRRGTLEGVPGALPVDQTAGRFEGLQGLIARRSCEVKRTAPCSRRGGDHILPASGGPQGRHRLR